MHLITISELSEVNFYGLAVQKVLLELLFFFFIFRQHQKGATEYKSFSSCLSVCFCILTSELTVHMLKMYCKEGTSVVLSCTTPHSFIHSVAAEQRRLFSHGNNIIIVIIIWHFKNILQEPAMIFFYISISFYVRRFHGSGVVYSQTPNFCVFY